MPRKLIKRLLPHPDRVKEHQTLKTIFGALLHDPNLWHLNRHSVAGAFAVGLFCAFIPLPLQTVIAAALAMIIRVNLPVSVVLVWITNPLTIAPIFYSAFKLGEWLLGHPPGGMEFEPSWDWLRSEFSIVWQPLFLGSLILGTCASVLGYCAIRLIWRLHVLHLWQKRRRGRARRDRSPSGPRDPS